MNLLNIESSPRGSRSASIAVGDAFVGAVRKARPDVTVDTLNVWEADLPEFDAEAIGAKYKGVARRPMDAAEAGVWERVQELAGRFRRADRIVVGVPMWNFSLPYKLKQLIDLASQRDLMFTFDGKAFGPLLQAERAMVIYTRGQGYAEGGATPASRFDHQTPFVDFWLGFVGVRDVRRIVVENTWGDKAEASIAAAKAEAERLAAEF